MDANSDMLRGHIDTIILLSLIDGDKDTNEIRRQIEEKSGNKYTVKQGTFYSAMQRLVKQLLIKEYRSSSTDGIRRKYFSLTEKGICYVENNRQEWQKSKEILDTLIEEDVKTYQDCLSMNDSNFPIPQIDSVLNQEEDQSYVNNEINNNNIEILTQEDGKNSQVSVSFVKSESINNSDSFDKSDKIDENSEKTGENVYPFEINDDDLYTENESNFNSTVEITIQHDDKLNCSESVKSIENSTAFEESESILNDQASNKEDIIINDIQTNEQHPYIDRIETCLDNCEKGSDLLNFENGAFANRREYKSILSTLFPKDKNDEYSPSGEIESKSENCLTLNNLEKIDTNENSLGNKEATNLDTVTTYDSNGKKINEGAKKNNYPHLDVTDFSDLYTMAKREGFKIKASFNTNKFNSNKILINKLNCHSSLLFFIVLFVEMLILNYFFDSVINWSINVKLTIVGIAAIFPIVMFLIYTFNRSRSVKNITSFKNVIEIALIITFQLIIIILCVALFAAIDFDDIKSVTEFILFPFIISLNIPFYFIIKYMLFSTKKYFDFKN